MADLFGNENIPQNVPKKTNKGAIKAHAMLLQIHGKSEGNRCKSCQFLLVKNYGNRYFKCQLFNQSSSASSDWRVNWEACGKFIKTKDDDTTRKSRGNKEPQP